MNALQSDAINELIGALIKAQANISHAVADAKNPAFKSSYASLESVIDATKKALLAEGLVLTQTTAVDERGLMVVTTLYHTSGQWLRSYTPVLNERNSCQSMGSGITYARRYAAEALCWLGSADSDDDGNKASGVDKKQVEQQRVNQKVKQAPAPAAKPPAAAPAQKPWAELGEWPIPFAAGPMKGMKLGQVDVGLLKEQLAYFSRTPPKGAAAQFVEYAGRYLKQLGEIA